MAASTGQQILSASLACIETGKRLLVGYIRGSTFRVIVEVNPSLFLEPSNILLRSACVVALGQSWPGASGVELTCDRLRAHPSCITTDEDRLTFLSNKLISHPATITDRR